MAIIKPLTLVIIDNYQFDLIVMAMRSNNHNIPGASDMPISGFNCGDIDYGDAFLGTGWGGWWELDEDLAGKLPRHIWW